MIYETWWWYYRFSCGVSIPQIDKLIKIAKNGHLTPFLCYKNGQGGEYKLNLNKKFQTIWVGEKRNLKIYVQVICAIFIISEMFS